MGARSRCVRWAIVLAFSGQLAAACTGDDPVEPRASAGSAGSTGNDGSTGGAPPAGGGVSGSGDSAGEGGAGTATAGGAPATGGATAHAGAPPFAGCEPESGEGGAGGALHPGIDGTHCACDGPWAECGIELEQFCFGPADFGCDPSLDRVLRTVALRCYPGWYTECEDGRVGVELRYETPERLSYAFDATGRLFYAKADPVENRCDHEIHTNEAAYVALSPEYGGYGEYGDLKLPWDDVTCRSCDLAADAEDACLVGDGRLTLPPAPDPDPPLPSNEGGAGGEGGTTGLLGQGGAP